MENQFTNDFEVFTFSRKEDKTMIDLIQFVIIILFLYLLLIHFNNGSIDIELKIKKLALMIKIVKKE